MHEVRRRVQPYGPESDRITSVPIRQGVVVQILDIPYDITPQEAQKIGAVIKALATT